MTVYRYALLMRPPCLGACPMNGMIRCSCEGGTAPSGHHYWGWCEYSRELTAQEINDYEMEQISLEG